MTKRTRIPDRRVRVRLDHQQGPVIELGKGRATIEQDKLSATASKEASFLGYESCYGMFDPTPVAVVVAPSVRPVRVIVRGVPAVAIGNGQMGTCKSAHDGVVDIRLTDFPKGSVKIYFGRPGLANEGSNALRGWIQVIDLEALPVVEAPTISEQERALLKKIRESRPTIVETTPHGAMSDVKFLLRTPDEFAAFEAKVRPWLTYQSLSRNSLALNLAQAAKRVAASRPPWPPPSSKRPRSSSSGMKNVITKAQEMRPGEGKHDIESEHDTDYGQLSPEESEDIAWAQVQLSIVEGVEGKASPKYQALAASYQAFAATLAERRAQLITEAIAKVRIPKPIEAVTRLPRSLPPSASGRRPRTLRESSPFVWCRTGTARSAPSGKATRWSGSTILSSRSASSPPTPTAHSWPKYGWSPRVRIT